MSKEIKRKDININKTVIAANGNEYPLSRCRKIAGVFYLIGDVKIKDSGDCYKIGDTYYRKTNVNLIWDFETQEYVFKTDKHINGIVGFNPGTGFEKGWFKINRLKNIPLSEKEIVYSMECLQKSDLSWAPLRGQFLKTERKEIFTREEILSVCEEARYPKKEYVSLPKGIYNASEMPIEEIDSFRDQWLKENGKTSVFDKFFFNYTLGAEIETAAGTIPENLLFCYGLLPLKDGSIPNHEYTTTVIKKYPFFLLKNIFEAVNKNTLTNHFCSLHYHIGGAPKTKEFTVAFWSLYYRLQDELDALTSPYKRDLSYLTTKIVAGQNQRGAKDHCKRIPALYQPNNILIEDTFNNIISFFNEGSYPKIKDREKLLYIHSRTGRHKWEFESRYYSVNLIPFLFEDKQTIEFRLHPGTCNFYKSFAWLMICIALIRFADQNMEMIIAAKEKIKLTDILSVFDDESEESKFLISWLKSYIGYRSLRYARLMLNHDLYGDEFIDDHDFKFEENGLSPLNFNLKK